MKISNTIQRLLIFFVGIPVIILPVLFLPHYHFLATNVIIIIVSLLATWEISRMFSNQQILHSRILAPISGLLLPSTAYLEVAGLVPPASVWAILIMASFIIFAKQIHPRKSGFTEVINRVGTDLFLLIYPGLFLSYLVRLSSLPSGRAVLILFLLLVFLNDSMAWFFGVLFGRNSPPVVAVSPNKSLVGFLGGLAASMAVGTAGAFFITDIFQGRLWLGIILGLLCGFTTILGDLFESALKRSAETKDSGHLIPGRGGMLDSLDSLLFTAPLLFYFITLIT